jgi:hypothetical protein
MCGRRNFDEKISQRDSLAGTYHAVISGAFTACTAFENLYPALAAASLSAAGGIHGNAGPSEDFKQSLPRTGIEHGSFPRETAALKSYFHIMIPPQSCGTSSITGMIIYLFYGYSYGTSDPSFSFE